jgi:hypothetical protein
VKRDIETKLVAIESQSDGNILYDKEWSNTGNFWFIHLSRLNGVHRGAPNNE